MTSFDLRPVSSTDDDFLFKVYAGARQEELARVDWEEPVKESFLQMQFAAQQAHYREYFPAASHAVLLAGGVPAGQMYIDRRETEIRILDLAVLPEARRQGIGSHFLQTLIREAQASGKVLSIHVDETSPALGWFQRWGFARSGGNGLSCLLEWRPAVPDPVS
jgi:ribosomal protein S18 acetylase RimI-like enzyme